MKKSKLFAYLTILVLSSIILGNLFTSWVFLIGAISSFALFIIPARLLPPKDIELKMERETRERVREIYVGDELEVTVHLENRGDTLNFVEIHDILPPLVDLIEGSNHQILSLGPGEKKELSYKVSCPVTGKIDIGPIRIRYKDAFGFFTKELKKGEEMRVQVLPKTEDMKKVDINPSYTKHWLGDIKSKSMGLGSEFFSLREYHPGDEFRDINWKATAKQLKPITNAYEGEKSGDVILVVDGYEEGIVGTMRNNSLRVSVDATATLASTILSARNRVGLIVASEFLNWVYPATGKNQYHRILSNLTKFERGGTWDLEEIKWLLEDFFPPRSMIIFISPLTVPKFSETIIDLCRGEYDVMVISPDPIKIENKIGDDHEEMIETLYHTERKHLLKRLWDNGALVVDWNPYEPLEPELEEVLRYRQIRG
ncbi:MAG: DUF58 domain-containing protein [Candidatus Thermoplasmatota archaeon]|nr:DUF58 domain-containing protein [Candidatus Thermoplasmatota archaeon]MBS3789613.1 DUF58 domain-containing protein [Candidatus Thermoplasmatota archaeon]